MAPAHGRLHLVGTSSLGHQSILGSGKFGRAGRLRSRHGATMGQESARPGEPSRA
jgi:hypothetical protein